MALPRAIHDKRQVIEGAGRLPGIQLLAGSRVRDWRGVSAYLSRGGPLEPLPVISTSHILSVPMVGSCEVELWYGSRSRQRHLAPGVVSLFPAYREHTFRSVGDPVVLNWQLGHEEFFRVVEQEFERDVPAIVIHDRFGSEDRTLLLLARQLAGLLESDPGPGACLRAESLQREVFIQVLRRHSSLSHFSWNGHGPVSAAQMRRAIELLHDSGPDPVQDLSLGRLASEAGLSPFHFARQFKRVTGQSPHQYLLAIRIERARALLAERSLSLVDVALRLGFSSQSHLTSVFRRAIGLTPGVYRAAILGHSGTGTRN